MYILILYYVLTDGTAPNVTKSQNPTVLGQGGPASNQEVQGPC